MEDNKQEEGNIEEEIGRYNLTENIDRVTRVVRGLTNKIIINDLRKIFKWVKDNPKFLGCPIIPDKARYMNYRGETAILDMGGRVVGVLDDSGQTVDFKSRPNHLPEFFRVETYSKEEIKNLTIKASDGYFEGIYSQEPFIGLTPPRGHYLSQDIPAQEHDYVANPSFAYIGGFNSGSETARYLLQERMKGI